MKFKQILKKVLKYVVTPFVLVGSIIGLYSIDSYAYTSDTFSHTLTYDTTINDVLYFDFSSTFNANVSKYVLLLNLSYINNGSSHNIACSIYDSSYISNGVFTNTSYINVNNNGVCTLVQSGTSNNTRTGVKLGINLYGYYTYSDILNIDFINKDDITTMYYLDTYVSNYQQQLAQLQQDYDTLENNFDTLQGQYDTLEDNYNTLEDNYNTLENNYNTLNNDYNNLTSQFPFYESNISNLTITSNSVVQSPTSENDYSIYKGNILQFNTRDFDYYNTLNTTGLNTFVYNYNFKYDYVLDNYSFYIDLRHSLDEDITLQFYYNNFLSYQTDIVPESDSQQNNYLEIAPITFNKLVITFNIDYSSLLENRYISLVYSNSFSDGYALGVKNTTDNLQPQIDSLNVQVESLKNEVQTKYDEGYYEGIAVGSSDSNSLYGMVIRT